MAELITPRSAGVRDELLSKVANHAGLRDEVLATLLGVSELDKLLPVTGFSSRDGLLAAKKVNLEREYEGVDGSLLPALATLVRKSKCLETLDFRWHEFGAHTGWEDFGAALTETTSLTNLNLDGTGLGDDGASAIARGLAANRSVSALWLRSNGIGDPGAIALGYAMATCRLELLWLWTNNVGDAGALSLARGLQASTTMRKLNIAKCNVGDEGCGAFAAALAGTSAPFEDIMFDTNPIGDAGVSALAEGIRVSSTLQQVLLNKCKVNEQGGIALAAAIAQSTSMQCLILDSNDLTDVASLAMADAILRSGGFSNVERYLQNGKERPHGMGGSHKAYLSLLANPRCSPGGMVAPKCAIALKQWCAGETTDEKLEELASHMALTLAHCGKALVPKWVSLLANAQPTRFITACVETALKCDRIGVQARAQSPALAESAQAAKAALELACDCVLDRQSLQKASASEVDGAASLLLRAQWTSLELAADGNCKLLTANQWVQIMRRELLDGEERSLTRVLHWVWSIPPGYYHRGGDFWDYGTRDSTAFSGAARSLAVYALVLIGVSLLQLPLLLVISLGGDPARRWLEERLVMTLHAHKRGTDDSHDPGRSHRPLRFNCVWVTAPLIRLWLTLFSSVGAALLCMSLPAWPARERTPAEMAAALYALSALLAEWDEISAHPRFARAPLFALANHLSDAWNLIDVCAIVLVAVAISLREASRDRWPTVDDEGFSRSLDGATHALAYAVFFLFLRPLKFLYISRFLGPFLFMVSQMLRDLAKNFMLVLLLQPAFIGAQTVLFRDLEPNAGCGLYGLGLTESVVALNEMFLNDRSAGLECLRLSPQHYYAWVLQVLYTAITMLMLLNMLIAALTKTYDTITDSYAPPSRGLVIPRPPALHVHVPVLSSACPAPSLSRSSGSCTRSAQAGPQLCLCARRHRRQHLPFFCGAAAVESPLDPRAAARMDDSADGGAAARLPRIGRRAK